MSQQGRRRQITALKCGRVIRSSRNALLLALTFSYFTLMGNIAHADLKPFTAVYTANFDSISAEATRKLFKQGQGWRLEQNADNFIASVEESSNFAFQDQLIKPNRYEYQRKVLGRKRHAVLDFDWQANTVLNDVEDKPWTMKIEPDTLDKLSYQLQLRLDIAQGKDQVSYDIADGGHIKTYHFKVVGEEMLDTEIGKLPTLKVERQYDDNSEKQTEIWFARDLDYLLVKISQTGKKGKESELLIKSYDSQ